MTYFAATNKLYYYMKKTCIIYGSSTGTCESIAQTIAARLGLSDDNVFNAGSISAEQIAEYDVLLLGTSTWGSGELQEDWYDGIKTLKSADLGGKLVALFGCGDCESYGDTFCGGMGVIYNELQDANCTFVGQVSADDYSFEASDAVVDGKFVGLALDDVNESEKTENRIDSWLKSIESYM